jgi:hypothetical protein
METTRELTREEWLTNAAELMAPLFINAGVEPKPVRISVGFPANKRAGKAGKVIGECHYMASDGVPQVFIHPSLTDGDRGPLPTLAHELAHAYLPLGTGHKRPFAKLVEALGLTGKPTSTSAGETFNTDMQAIADVLGEYPHAALDVSDIKKQSTRMIKIQCNGEIHAKPLIWRTPQSNIDRTDIIRCWNGECDSMPTVG